MKANRLFIACVATVALAACGGSTELTASLSGKAEKPEVNTSASGSTKVTIDGSKMSVSGSFKDLSSNATAAHIHGPVTDASGIANPFCNLNVPTGTSGSITADASANPCSAKELSESEIADFEAGKFYVNIHSANHTGGELRGDLKKAE